MDCSPSISNGESSAFDRTRMEGSLIRALVIIKKATAVANKEYGIEAITVHAISKVCDEILNRGEEKEKLWVNEELSLTDKNINKHISERASCILKEGNENCVVVEEAIVTKNVGTDPPTLGDEFTHYVSRIDSDIKRYEMFLPKICYLETESMTVGPEGFLEKLAAVISEITGLPFLIDSSEKTSDDIRIALLDISGSLNVIGNYLKEMTSDINYFPEVPQYELRDLNVIIKDLEEGSVVLREHLVPTHREILVAITTHLAYNHSSVIFAFNHHCSYNSINIKTMIAIYLLRSLKLIIHGINFLSKQLPKGSSHSTPSTRTQSPCSEFGSSELKKTVQ